MVDNKTLRAAVAALSFDVPVLTSRLLEDGSVELTTRNGVHIWRPEGTQSDAPKPKRKSRSRKKVSGES